jgi:hypothetical protein
MSWCRAHTGICGQILLPVQSLLSQICSLVSVGHPLLPEDGSTICSVIIQWSKSCRTRNHTSLSHLRLPNLEGEVPVFISRRNRVAQLYSQALGSLYVVSYDSQGYGGGILTLPIYISFRNRMVQSKVKVMLRPRASQSVCLGV